MRIGHGYDVHRFGEGDFITLGGVRIPHKHGLVAHSDGDDCCCTPCPMRCSARRRWATSASTSRTPTRGLRGADSRALLRHVVAIVAEKGWKVGNVDATIVAQAPKMRAAHRDHARVDRRGPRRRGRPGQRQGHHYRAARFHRTRRGHCCTCGRFADGPMSVLGELDSARAARPWGSLRRGGAQGRGRGLQVDEVLDIPPAVKAAAPLVVGGKARIEHRGGGPSPGRAAGVQQKNVSYAGLKGPPGPDPAMVQPAPAGQGRS